MLPEDFNVEDYKNYNLDLKNLTDEELKEHYILHGQRENRIYKLNLPDDFNPEIYKLLNPDLEYLCDFSLKKHFLSHGQKEGRDYKDILFDENFFVKYNNLELEYQGYKTYLQDIRKFKSSYVKNYIDKFKELECDYLLVDHCSTINGASLSLYNLRDFLNLKNKKVLILNPCKESGFFINYKKDATLLYWLCQKIKYKKIIFNSINFSMGLVMKWIDRSKLILFSREIKKDYIAYSPYNPDFVLSKAISEQYENKPKVQPPIVSQNYLDKLELDSQILEFIPNFDTSKITLGMCGFTGDRKNVKLFLEVAEILSKYNFIWIGGKELNTSLSNVYHIKDTENVGKCFALLDYFVLFSEEEPFGRVVIENLYLENKVLTFRDNIYYDHKSPELQYLYYEFPGKITKQNALIHISSNCLTKNKKDTKNGKLYVQKHFTSYDPDFLKFIEI